MSDENKTNKSVYLGDGVYLSNDGYQLWLAVNSPDNLVVALDHEVFMHLTTEGAIMFGQMQLD